MNEKIETELYQSVLIEMNNGEVFVFTGKGNIKPRNQETRQIKNILFTLPRELPEGCIWETIEKEKLLDYKEDVS
jgi:hypothetical protein